MTEDELAAASDEIQDLREEVRAELAADLGEEPEDYESETYFENQGSDSSGEVAPDGGE